MTSACRQILGRAFLVSIRIRPRNLDVALGSDNVWKKDRYALGGKITVVNLMNKIALYNLLSSFSGLTS